MPKAALADVARIEALWRDCRSRFAKGGKFLFGRFCNADAMYAPVVARFETYAVAVRPDTRAYMDNVMATPAFRAWKEAALKETDSVTETANNVIQPELRNTDEEQK